MIKIGNNKFDTYPLNKCNLKGLPNFVFLVPMTLDTCPICGRILILNYCYGIQISNTEVIKTHGSACIRCNSFFSSMCTLFTYLEKKRVNKSSYTLKNDYCVKYDLVQHNSRYRKTKSAFCQFTVLAVGKLYVFTIVTELDFEDKEKNIIHYSSKTAIELLKAEKEHKNFVEIDGITYCIINIKKKEIDNADVKEDIDSIVANKELFNDEIPEFSSSKTLYVYKGIIACHNKHHVVDFNAIIKLLDNNINFYVQYCYECNKFIMKEDDYNQYLHKLKLFPMKVCADVRLSTCDIYNRAEKSTLFLSGYTVNQQVGLSSGMRQSILSYIMDHGIVDKRKILDHLEDFINLNQNNPNRTCAINKWKEDKQFVLNYKQREFPIVNIGKLERK